MEYNGYTIKAEVTESNCWTLTEDGEIDERSNDGAQFDVTGYFLFDEAGNQVHFAAMGESDADELHAMVDQHIAELAKGGA